MEERILFENSGFRLILSRTIDTQLISFLDQVIWGTPGGIRYKKTPYTEKSRDLPGLQFLKLFRKERLIGTLGLLYKEITVEGRKVHTYYIRNFAFAEEFRVKLSAGETRKKKTPTRARESSFRQRIANLFLSGEAFTQIHGEEPVVFWAYVINNNERSGRLVREFDFTERRTFRTLVYNTGRPGIAEGFTPLSSEEIPYMRALLEEYYRRYSKVDIDRILGRDRYFVLKKDNEIIAGISAQSVRWELVHLPGWSGKILMNILPKLPLLKNILNPKDFRFAGMEGIYLRQGKEAYLEPLFKSVCAQLGVKVAMTWQDAESTLCGQIEESVNLGFIHRLSRNTDAVSFVTRYLNCTQEIEDAMEKSPVYISGIEVI